MKTKITMFLLNEKGYYVLKRFIDVFGAKYIEAVISSHDFNIENDYYYEISSLCNENNIVFYDKNQTFSINGQYIFAIGWRWMINKINNKRLIIFHDSLLPRYRGFAPLVSCLINSEPQIGVTALFASDEYDKGPIIKQVYTDIDYPIKINRAITLIKPLYFSLVEAITIQIINGEIIKSFPQDESQASYSLWRNEEDYRIDWDKDSDYIKRFIDAVGYPYKGAFSYVDGKKIRIFDAETIPDVKVENRDVGKVIFTSSNCPVIVCGKGLLKLTNVIDDDSKKNILPLDSFRIRFK